MGLISGCRYLKVNLKAKMYICVNSTISKCVPTKLLKFFWLKIFLICHRCQRHRWSTLSCEYLREFSRKFETVLMGYSGAWGKLIDEKNQKQKISWHCPFKYTCTEWLNAREQEQFGCWTLCGREQMEGVDLAGKVVVVTGANTGIGYQIALEAAKR